VERGEDIWIEGREEGKGRDLSAARCKDVV
jgi:hypothetical protein